MQDSDAWEMDNMPRGRRYSVSSDREAPFQAPPASFRFPGTSEDLHAWSIYRQNLNSDFTDSALGSKDKSPLPYGNFQLRESTMQSILNNPKYGPRSELGINMYTYLKFGLPRVMPFGMDEALAHSSGYDSTDEELGDGDNTHLNKSRARLRAARSEEFLDRANDERRGGRNQGNHVKSFSEANLLNSDAYYDTQQLENFRKETSSRRSDVRISRGNEGYINHGLVEDERAQSRLRMEDHKSSQHGLHEKQRGQFGSRAVSQLSISGRQSKQQNPANFPGGAVSYRHDAPILNDKYFPKDTYGSLGNIVDTEDPEGFKYPHLQLRNVSYSIRRGRKEERILDMINIEARGGELVAILASSREEGTTLCNIIANRHGGVGTKFRGDILINGNNIQPSRLADRVSLVDRNINFTTDMSVRQTILFHSLMREPGTLTRGRDTKGRIDALIEDLGLSQVKHTRVADLTVSEKQRLNVACHLQLDTDIVILDQPTDGMDIFDTFFLVEYLRQWAARGRIVILTIHPPTYEIFTMISKVILLSLGRLMYFGKRREMLPYFAFIEYPCPAYKNPSDYYLDLVTLDDLSPEAMLESSQRVEQLSSIYQRKCEPLSDPGPPGIMPPKIRRANLLMQIFGLWIRAMIYMYPFNVINWVKLVLLSGAMSLCVGAVFVGIRWRYWDRLWQSDHVFAQENVNDRLGFHHVMMVAGVWPVLLNVVTEVWTSKPQVTRDLDDRLYSRFAYSVTKTLYSLPSSAGVFLAFSVPAYLLTGIHYPATPDLNSFYIYLGYMMVYLLCIQMLAITLAHLSFSRHLAAVFCGFILLCQALVSHYVIHKDDLAIWVQWIRYVSPQYWMNHPIMMTEISQVKTFHCHHNPMITDDKTGIIKQVACGLPSGKQALEYFSLSTPAVSLPADVMPLAVIAFFLGILFILSILSFCLCRQHQGKKRRKRES